MGYRPSLFLGFGLTATVPTLATRCAWAFTGIPGRSGLPLGGAWHCGRVGGV